MFKGMQTVVIMMLTAVLSLAGSADAKTACEVAVAYERPEHAPAASDVSIRSLGFRPMDKNDPQNTLEAMQEFHATRLEWVYLRFNEDEKRLIRKVKDMGRVFGAAGEPGTGVVVCLEPGREFIAYSLLAPDGTPLFQEHSTHWVKPIYPGCMNNPVYLKNNLDYYVKNVEYGAEVLQRDGAAIQYHYATTCQGCFCEYCMDAFREFLKRTCTPEQLREYDIPDIDTFNYLEWLKRKDLLKDNRTAHLGNPLFRPFVDFSIDTSTRFYTKLRTAIDVCAMKHAPMSHNNTSHQQWELPINTLFDFAISELIIENAHPAHIYERSCKARRLGSVQVFGTPKSMGETETAAKWGSIKRQVIATAYASGGLARVPWDMFEDTRDGRGRYFGTPEEYADLYGYIRANSEYMEGYEDAGAFGEGIKEDRYGTDVPVEISGNEKIYAFIRAVPGDKTAPVVIHLVDWNARPEAFEVKLKNDCFFDTAMNIKLLVPVPYQETLHKQAEAKAQAMLEPEEKLSARHAAAYARLSAELSVRGVVKGEYTMFELPAVTPWAMVVVAPRAN